MLKSPFKGKRGVGRVINAFGYSVDGVLAAWRHEAAFRQIIILATLGMLILFWLPVPLWSKSLIILSNFICIIVELLNSAIEAAVDHTSLEKHELAKRAKDLGSASQLFGLINLTAMWLIAFGFL